MRSITACSGHKERLNINDAVDKVSTITTTMRRDKRLCENSPSGPRGGFFGDIIAS